MTKSKVQKAATPPDPPVPVAVAPKIGRPLKLPPANAEPRIQALAAAGFSMRGIASHLGTSFETLQRWLESDPALKEAFDLGRENERQVLHNVVYKAATEGTGKDALLAAFYLLNSRHGYRDPASDAGNRVSITFNMPAAMPLDAFTIAAEHDPSH